MIYRLAIFLTIMLPLNSWGQFVRQGTITYEKKFKLKRAVEWESEYEQFRKFAKDITADVNTHFTLTFSQKGSAYQFLKDTSENKGGGWFVQMISNESIAGKNQVYTDFEGNTRESIKKVFEKTFLIKDSIPHFRWKIENEVRVIAGYPCRKAVTTICDSVVVVAFYSDQIMVSGGPESFNGLPGMILGIAIPRLYTTWFATDVSTAMPKFTPPDIPKKVEKTDTKSMIKEIKRDTKGSRYLETEKIIWQVLL